MKVEATIIRDGTGREDPNCLHCAVGEAIKKRLAETSPGAVLVELLQNVGEVIGSFCTPENLGQWVELSQEHLASEAQKAAEAFAPLRRKEPMDVDRGGDDG